MQKWLWLVLAILIGIRVTQACNNNPGNNIPTPSPAPAPSPVDPTPSPTPPNPSPTPSPSPGSDPVGATDFDTWCLRSALTKAIQGYGNNDFSSFCTAGAATNLLKTTLIGTAYNGTGTPNLTFIEPIASDGASKTTHGYFASAIKLPISAQSYFQNVAPQVATPQYQTQLAQANGATLTNFQVLSTFANDGPYEIQGFTLHTVISKTVVVIDVTQDSIVRVDDHDLANNAKLYLYTQVFQSGAQIVKDFRILSAGIQVGNAAYLFNLTRVTVDNKGFAKQAEQELLKTAQSLISTIFSIAAKAPTGNPGTPSPGTPSPGTLTFASDINPILQIKCASCHSGGNGLPNFAENEAAFKALKSKVVNLINTTNQDSVMPPPEANNPLAAAEKAKINSFLAQ